MKQDVMFSSKTNEWETPPDFFSAVNTEFHFTLDPASTHENAKCEKHYTILENGLLQSWANEVVFCNPPYGREQKLWIMKAFEESRAGNAKVVMLLPARTDTAAFHDYIYGKAEIRFLRGRLKFGESKNAAPFPSMIIVF